jgi:hypothetical protein
MTSVPLSADCRETLARTDLRDLSGIAVGVAAGALVWLVFLSLMRLPI